MRGTGSPWDLAVTVPVELIWEMRGLPAIRGEPLNRSTRPSTRCARRVLPAAVVRAASVADACRLRAAYAGAETMAFFPAEALRELYALLGDVRRLMSLFAIVSQALVLLAITASMLILFRLLTPLFVTLQAVGAPRAYVFAVAWGFTAALLLAGAALGLLGGALLSRAVGALLARETGVALAPSLGWSEVALADSVLAAGLAPAVLPAWIVQRRPLADT